MARTPGGPYVEERVIQHTELVYFDADGNEVGREGLDDHSWYDTRTTREPDDVELADWYEQ